MIPSLFTYAILQCQTRFLQTQNIVVPMMITSGITSMFHVLVCWSFIYKFGLGIEGAALANTISNWVNVVLLGVYVKFSSACVETWTGFSSEAFNDILVFWKLVIPSAFMICLEYWSFEMVVLLSGLLPNPQLETSVLSICNRVANELGSGNAQGARLSLKVMGIIALLVGAIVGATTLSVRHVWGSLYSNGKEVIAYVAKMIPLLALSDFLDGFQCVLSARGCGWQKLCVYINLGAYYGVAIPSAAILAFIVHIGGKRLWIRIICGLTVQIVALVIVNVVTDWNHEARKATESVEKTSLIADQDIGTTPLLRKHAEVKDLSSINY